MITIEAKYKKTYIKENQQGVLTSHQLLHPRHCYVICDVESQVQVTEASWHRALLHAFYYMHFTCIRFISFNEILVWFHVVASVEANDDGDEVPMVAELTEAMHGDGDGDDDGGARASGCFPLPPQEIDRKL
ncbi:hypothetical protein Droror1_Dr00000924 [Drosera rotundifolia]